MSFSLRVRKELARVPCERKCCAYAELLGAVLTSGGLTFRGMGRYALNVSVGGEEAARRCLNLIKRFLYCDCQMVAIASSRLGGQTRYEVIPGEGDVPRLMKELKLLAKDQPFGMRAVPADEMIKSDCDKRAFLRGAFLAGGSTGDPEKAYHLEIAARDEALADFIRAMFVSLGVPARHTQRKTQQVVYVKDGEHMATALSVLGAHQALMELENVRILKDIRNEANRQANCDTANVDKTLAAAEQQLSVISVIEKRAGLSSLPPPLREVAEMRVKFPDASLGEIGGMLTPSIGKSGVKARMRRLEAIAEELLNG